MTDLSTIEAYLDATPRTGAKSVEVGPFSLFLTLGPWSYYARPRLGLADPIAAQDIDILRARCDSEGVPVSIEWIGRTTPSLALAARAAGLVVTFRPLLSLEVTGFAGAPTRARILPPGDPTLASARAVAELGFADPGTDIGTAGPEERDTLAVNMPPNLLQHMEDRARAGYSVTAAVSNSDGIVSVGVHQPVGAMTEIVGVATLPAARRHGHAGEVTRALVAHARSIGVRTAILSADSLEVARIYERVGFRWVATSCEAGPPEVR